MNFLFNMFAWFLFDVSDIWFLPTCWWSLRLIHSMGRRLSRKSSIWFLCCIYVIFFLLSVSFLFGIWFFEWVGKVCLSISSCWPLINATLQIQKWPRNFGDDKSNSSLSTEWNIGIWENPEGEFKKLSSLILCWAYMTNCILFLFYFSFSRLRGFMENIDVQSNRRTIMDDPFIRNYIEDLLKNIRTQVLLKLIKPYTRIRIPFISKVAICFPLPFFSFNFLFLIF